MRLIEEILRSIGAEAGMRPFYTVSDGLGGYFQGVKRILEFSEERAVLQCGGRSLRVEGKGLFLGKYGGGDVVLRGEIVRVEQL